MKFKQKGFTLIELMITVAVVGILAAIAYPSYQGQIRKSRRAEAQATLMNVAGRQQQFLLDTRTYASSLSELGVSVPSSVSAFYTITLSVTNSASVPSAFTATATPLGGQANDACASLSIDQAGAKLPTTCW